MEDTNMTQNPGSMQPQKQNGSMGPLLGIIIIVLVLAAGGLYMWYTNARATQTGDTPSTAQDATYPAGENNNQSDTASAIEAELSASDTGNAAGDLQLQ